MFKVQRSLLIVICAALVLAACSGTTAGSSSTGSTVGPTTAPTAVSTNTPAPTATAEATATPEATPTPAATAAASLTGGQCLVGSWKFTDMSDYFTSVMSKVGGDIKYVGQEGNINYTFGADGKAKAEASNFTVKLQANTQGLALDINVKIDGSATADYTTNESNQVTFANAQTSGFKFSATLNGQELFSGTPDEMAALFGVSDDPRYNTFTYECSATTLKYTPPVPNARPVVWERVP